MKSNCDKFKWYILVECYESFPTWALPAVNEKKKKFTIKDLFSKFDQIHRNL